MTIAVLILAWLGISLPVSIVVGVFVRGDDRELIGVDGCEAVYLLRDGTVARAAIPVPA